MDIAFIPVFSMLSPSENFNNCCSSTIHKCDISSHQCFTQLSHNQILWDHGLLFIRFCIKHWELLNAITFTLLNLPDIWKYIHNNHFTENVNLVIILYTGHYIYIYLFLESNIVMRVLTKINLSLVWSNSLQNWCTVCL